MVASLMEAAPAGLASRRAMARVRSLVVIRELSVEGGVQAFIRQINQSKYNF